MKKKKKVSFITKLRNYFITGVVVLIPIGITLYLTLFFFKVFSRLIPKEINSLNTNVYYDMKKDKHFSFRTTTQNLNYLNQIY